MMSQVIRQETLVFFASVLHGAVLVFFYDLIRVVRRVFPHSLAAVSAEDFLFWLAAGFLTFCLLFQETDGVVRWYVVAGALLGTTVYLNLCSALVLRVFQAVLGTIRRLFLLVWRQLVRCARVLRRLAGRCVRRIGRLVRRIGRRIFAPVRRKAEKLKKRIACRRKNQLKKRIEFKKKRVYNKKTDTRKCSPADSGKQKRGSINGSEKKKARKQKQPPGDAVHRRDRIPASARHARSEPAADHEK